MQPQFPGRGFNPNNPFPPSPQQQQLQQQQQHGNFHPQQQSPQLMHQQFPPHRMMQQPPPGRFGPPGYPSPQHSFNQPPNAFPNMPPSPQMMQFQNQQGKKKLNFQLLNFN